jgi:hypothetical protein
MLFYDLRLFKDCYKKVITAFVYMRYGAIFISRPAIKIRVGLNAKNPGRLSRDFWSNI